MIKTPNIFSMYIYIYKKSDDIIWLDILIIYIYIYIYIYSEYIPIKHINIIIMKHFLNI